MSATVRLTITTDEMVNVGDALRRVIKAAQLETDPINLPPTHQTPSERKQPPPHDTKKPPHLFEMGGLG